MSYNATPDDAQHDTLLIGGPTMPESRPRRFTSLTRTPTPQGFTVLDAIDSDGRAWWLVLGDDAAPDDWTELEPLPTYEAQP